MVMPLWQWSVAVTLGDVLPCECRQIDDTADTICFRYLTSEEHSKSIAFAFPVHVLNTMLSKY